MISAPTAAARTWALVSEVFTPPTRLKMSAWAERYRFFSVESNPEPGPWRNDRVPFLADVMDAITDPAVSSVALMCSSQSAKTEIVLNTIGYYSTEEPAPILLVMPTLEDARQWSRTRFAPMIRDSPRLTNAFAVPAAKDSSNSTLVKNFAGGHLTAVGANSASGLASKPIRIALFDEVDRYPPSAGTEGDPIDLGTTRTRRFWNRKILKVSSPSVRDKSRIEQAYLEGDRNQLWIPCPECGVFQILRWDAIRWDHGDPSTALGVCVHCGVLAEDYRWQAGLERCEWRPLAPRIGAASYWWSALYMPWVRWADLADQFQKAQGDNLKLQVFINTVLAETWEEVSRVADPKVLEDRAEGYDAPVPDGIAFLTAGIDLGQDRIEYVVRGWGIGEESYLIEAGWIDGEPTKPGAPVYDRLEKELRLKTWARSDGVAMGLTAVCIDSGKWTDAVYSYAGPRWGNRVWATKGSSQGVDPLIPNRPLKRKKGERCHVTIVGTEQAKTLIYGRLAQTEPGPGTYHWPADPTLLPAHYWETLTSERPARLKKRGRWVTVYELPRGKRAEALDCEVLALVAWRLCRLNDNAIRAALAKHGPPLVEKLSTVGDTMPAGSKTPRILMTPPPAKPVPLPAWARGVNAPWRQSKQGRQPWMRRP